jgi:sterol 14-demethylase
VGNFLEYRRDHVAVFRRGYQTLGPIFCVRLGPQRAVVLIGPEHHRFFFAAVDTVLSMPEVYRFVIPMFGGVLNAAKDEATRRGQLALIQSAFQGKRMEGYVEVMVRETTAWLEGLGDAGEFEVYETFAGLGMTIAASAFVGPEVRQRIDEFAPLFHDLARGMDFVLPPYLPLPRFRQRDRARLKLAELIGPVIAARRARPRCPADFLQTLVDGEYAGGGRDETVIGLALMSVFTGYIATAAQLSWALVHLLQHPNYLGLVQGEREAVLGDRPEEVLTPRIMDRLPRLDCALKESQRLRPAMSHYARYNAREYERGGYRIPRGWLTMVCPAVAHRLPEVFRDPDVYDPERFAPGRAEDHKEPHGLIGFGGGPYRCPGSAFGTAEMKCVLSLLLHRYSLELAGPDPGPDFAMGVTRPRPPCRVRYRRRGAAARRPVVHAGGPYEQAAEAVRND